MDSFYVTIGISPGSSTNDLISVGLIIWANGRFDYRISAKKVRLAKDLFTTSLNGIRWSLDQITTRLAEENDRIGANANQIFVQEPRYRADFFDYLSRYSNGLIRFSPPRKVNFEATGENFDRFYGRMIDADDLSHQTEATNIVPKKYTKEQFRERIASSIIRPLSEEVHTNFTVSPKMIPEIFFNIELDCIGKNGLVYAAKSLDFENVSAPTQDRHICHLLVFLDAKEKHYPPVKGTNKYFVIADEPSDIESDVHRYWEAIQKIGKAQVVPLEEAKKVADIILDSKATKFL